MKNKLLVLSQYAEVYGDLLKNTELPDLDIVLCTDAIKSEPVVQDCNIILGNPYLVKEVLDKAVSLEWVQSTFAGVDALCLPGSRDNYILTGVKDVFGPLMSEYVFAYILADERKLSDLKANQDRKIWEIAPYRKLNDLHIGICGFGSIGKHLAKTAKHFDMIVSVFKRTSSIEATVDFVYSGESEFKEFLKPLDYLVLTLPKTAETNGIINKNSLKNMKSTAVVINVGRGNAIIENDLINALEENQIRGAVLDVFNNEPLNDESKLWQLPNVHITPHNSALSFPKDVMKIFKENYIKFCNKDSLKYQIGIKRGY